jgi:predicted RecB family nuclease
MDRKLKVYFDKYRAMGKLPPELKGKVEGKLYDDLAKMDVWRNVRKGLGWTDENGDVLFGAIDDCLVDGKNFIIIDFKTYGGSEIKEEKIEFYQNQMDCYALLFEKNGLKHPGFVYLIFFMPVEVKENGIVEFKIEVKKVKVDSSRALKTFKDAVKLAKGKRPAKHSECTYCSWASENWKFE